MNTLLYISLACGIIACCMYVWLAKHAFHKHIAWGFTVLLLSPVSAVVFGLRYWRDEKKLLLAYLASLCAALGLSLHVFAAWGGWELVQAAWRVHQDIRMQDPDEQDAYTFMYANLRFIEHASPGQYERRKIGMIREFLDEYQQDMPDGRRKMLLQDVTGLLEDTDPASREGRELVLLQTRLAEQLPVRVPERDDPATQPETRQAKIRSSESMRPSDTRVHYRADYRDISITDAKNYIGSSFKVTRRNSDEQDCRLVGASPGRLRFEQRGNGGTFTFEYRYRDIEKLKLLTSTDA